MNFSFNNNYYNNKTNIDHKIDKKDVNTSDRKRKLEVENESPNKKGRKEETDRPIEAHPIKVQDELNKINQNKLDQLSLLIKEILSIYRLLFCSELREISLSHLSQNSPLNPSIPFIFEHLYCWLVNMENY